MTRYVIGIDFGTGSVRSVVVNGETGKEEASEVVYYSRWTEGKYCDPPKNQFRQHPLDYIESLNGNVKLDDTNCLDFVLGENNVLINY